MASLVEKWLGVFPLVMWEEGEGRVRTKHPSHHLFLVTELFMKDWLMKDSYPHISVCGHRSTPCPGRACCQS